MFRLIVLCVAVVATVVYAHDAPALSSAKFTKYTSRVDLEEATVESRINHFVPTDNRTFTYVRNVFGHFLEFFILTFGNFHIALSGQFTILS